MKKIVLFFLLFVFNAFAQKDFSDQQHAWVTYLGNHKLTKKFGLHTEYQWRREEWFQNWQQSLMRIGIDYNVNSNLSITAGYGWIVTFPYGEQPVLYQFNEHRIWQQLNLKSKIELPKKVIEVQHRYRLEQRFLETYHLNSVDAPVRGETIFRQRVRYRALFLIPISKNTMEDNTLFLNINNEVFIGFGKGIEKNILDQNRFNIALGWRFTSNFNLQFGYLNQYVLKADGVKIERNHTLLSSLVYNIDITGKNKKRPVKAGLFN
jgi:opacity protein-like surface antigen